VVARLQTAGETKCFLFCRLDGDTVGHAYFNPHHSEALVARGRQKQSDTKGKNGNGANLGFEADLFLAADKLRKNLEPSDYKHVVLGLIFLRHISQAFEAKRKALLAEDAAAAEDPDEYLAANVFWVPKEARWTHLQALTQNKSARDVMGEAALRIIAHELVTSLKGSVTVDWMHRDAARARMRVLVKRILRKYGYPPDLQDAAVQTVLQQAEALSSEWARAA
jgi:hypothetical protein